MRTETEDLRAELTTTQATIIQEQASIASLQGQVNEATTPIQPLMDRVNALEDLLLTLRFSREHVVGDINTVVSLKPSSSMYLTSIESSGGVLTIGGEITSLSGEQTIFDYATDLRASGRFAEVIVTQIIAAEGDEDNPNAHYNFTLTLL
jgi:hypothetical protein